MAISILNQEDSSVLNTAIFETGSGTASGGPSFPAHPPVATFTPANIAPLSEFDYSNYHSALSLFPTSHSGYTIPVGTCYFPYTVSDSLCLIFIYVGARRCGLKRF